VVCGVGVTLVEDTNGVEVPLYYRDQYNEGDDVICLSWRTRNVILKKREGFDIVIPEGEYDLPKLEALYQCANEHFYNVSPWCSSAKGAIFMNKAVYPNVSMLNIGSTSESIFLLLGLLEKAGERKSHIFQHLIKLEYLSLSDQENFEQKCQIVIQKIDSLPQGAVLLLPNFVEKDEKFHRLKGGYCLFCNKEQYLWARDVFSVAKNTLLPIGN
jgi:hypothetical protein